MPDQDLPRKPPWLAGEAVSTAPSGFLDVPEDAGRYRDSLVMILQRIPDWRPRFLSCGPGWYPLIARLHADLADLDIDYEVHQVKEKYGALRYYAWTEDSDMQVLFAERVAVAEARSVEICEWCGQPGRLSTSSETDPWYKTVCESCAEASAARGVRYCRLRLNSEQPAPVEK